MVSASLFIFCLIIMMNDAYGICGWIHQGALHHLSCLSPASPPSQNCPLLSLSHPTDFVAYFKEKNSVFIFSSFLPFSVQFLGLGAYETALSTNILHRLCPSFCLICRCIVLYLQICWGENPSLYRGAPGCG